MKTTDFEALKDFILSKNTCFAAGYANAIKDVETEAVIVKNGSDHKRLLPDDSAGNYFYIRNELSIRHDAKPAERLADNGTQRLVFNDVITCYLVAIVKDADLFALLENLKNTVMMYKPMSLQPLSSNWNREQVIKEEMSGMRKEDIAATLQRLKNETIVKLVFNASQIYVPGNCINPL